VSESLTRFYRDKYEPYFSVSSGEGRHRKYSQQTIELIQFISKCYTDKMDHSQIVDALDSLYGVPVDNTVTDLMENNKTKVVQQEDLVHSIRHVLLEELTKQKLIILQLQEELGDMRAEFNKELTGLHEKVEDGRKDVENRDREVLQHLNDIKKEQQQRNKPLWKRIFSRT